LSKFFLIFEFVDFCSVSLAGGIKIFGGYFFWLDIFGLLLFFGQNLPISFFILDFSKKLAISDC